MNWVQNRRADVYIRLYKPPRTHEANNHHEASNGAIDEQDSMIKISVNAPFQTNKATSSDQSSSQA